MYHRAKRLFVRLLVSLSPCLLVCLGCTAPDIWQNILIPEQRSVNYRDPDQLPPVRIPANVPPRTVSNPRPSSEPWPLSLDEALRIALQNSRVVRVLAGTTATSSGQTIYDATVTNTTIDQQQAVFDPTLKWINQWGRTNTPEATSVFNLASLVGGIPTLPPQTLIASTPTDNFQSSLSLTKMNVLGGQWTFNASENQSILHGSNGLLDPLFPSFPLNPQNVGTVQAGYTQPLLQGAGERVNLAPVIIARINTEMSFFQYKDSVQELVRSVVEAYWNLVQARLNAWARDIQVQQADAAYKRELARLNAGFADASNVAQAKVTYTQFLANRVAADAAVIAAEGTLRNLLGLLPDDDRTIIPISAPTAERSTPNWDDTVKTAATRRPDIIELKLIVEAEKQRLIQAQNQNLPQLNAFANYQWNGLSGTMPNGGYLETAPGQYLNWTAGVSFSVPLGLRQGRAMVRQEKLLIEKDQANLNQGLHAALHELALTMRNLDSAYEQYVAFRDAREAADINVRVQSERFAKGLGIYLIVLQALNDWGNAITSESASLLNYNIALATLERQTGVILEKHGLHFLEERSLAHGPLGVNRFYPAAIVPAGVPQRYPGGDVPAENFFDLNNPAARKN